MFANAETKPRLQIVDVTAERRGEPGIVVVGIGGCGCNNIDRMIAENIPKVRYIAMNTDLQELNTCRADLAVQLGPKTCGGHGAGGNCEIGETAADESRKEIEDSLQNCRIVFISAGMGGGTGTGASPIVAKIAKDIDAITIGVVSRPFAIEGPKRSRIAEEGLEKLRNMLDMLIVIPNDGLINSEDADKDIGTVLSNGNRILKNAVEGISNIISTPGLMNLDFNDIKSVVTTGGGAMMGTGCCTGEKRADVAARSAISDPLLENISIDGAKSLLISIHCPKDASAKEFHDAASVIQDAVGNEADVYLGVTKAEDDSEEFKVTVIATGFGQEYEEDDVAVRFPGFPTETSEIATEKQYPISFTASKGSADVKSQRNTLPVFMRRDMD